MAQAYDREKEKAGKVFAFKNTHGKGNASYVGFLVIGALALLILIRVGFRGAVSVSGSAGLG